MKRRHLYGGPPCPTDPAHGELLAFEGVRGFFCPHDLHDPKGDQPGTSPWFTQEQVEQERVR